MSINLKTHEWAKANKISSYFYNEIDSTNTSAKKLFSQEQSDFALYLADHQTHGKGRDGRSWQNMAAGEILLSTWCFKRSQSPQPILTPLLGLAVYDSLMSFPKQLPLRLKAPNDILVDNAKLSGLLVEVSQMGNDFEICVGLGLNVFGSPKVDQTTSYLQEYTVVDDQNWWFFCGKLLANFKQALNAGTKQSLTPAAQQKLLNALNHRLPESEKYLAISPQCDLHTPAGQIPWKQL